MDMYVRKKQLYRLFKIIYHIPAEKNNPLQAARDRYCYRVRVDNMRFLKRHASKMLLAAAVLMLAGGLAAGEHNMFFTYAIVICLNCIGIG